MSALSVGRIAPSGKVTLRLIPARPSDLPTRWGLIGRRGSLVERELNRLRALFERLKSPNALWQETARLENLLGLPPAEPTFRDEDRLRVLQQYFKVLSARTLGKLAGVMVVDAALALDMIYGDGRIWKLGIVSRKVVTTAGVNFLVDALQNIVEPEILKYHGIGTGAVAEAVGDTALGIELTTQYNPDGTRATGNLAEGASANIFHTEGTNTLDSGAPAVTEHGVFSQALVGGTLLDRSVFAAINLNGVNGDGLLSKYELTLSAGG